MGKVYCGDCARYRHEGFYEGISKCYTGKKEHFNSWHSKGTMRIENKPHELNANNDCPHFKPSIWYRLKRWIGGGVIFLAAMGTVPSVGFGGEIGEENVTNVQNEFNYGKCVLCGEDVKSYDEWGKRISTGEGKSVNQSVDGMPLHRECLIKFLKGAR